MTSRTLASILSAAALGAMVAGLSAGASAAKDQEIVAVVKIEGIPWFNRFAEGVKQAGADLHVKATRSDPRRPTRRSRSRSSRT